jgi:hypothetical protein
MQKSGHLNGLTVSFVYSSPGYVLALDGSQMGRYQYLREQGRWEGDNRIGKDNTYKWGYPVIDTTAVNNRISHLPFNPTYGPRHSRFPIDVFPFLPGPYY